MLMSSLQPMDDAEGVPQGGTQPSNRVLRSCTLCDILQRFASEFIMYAITLSM